VPASDNDDYVFMSMKVMTHHLNNWLLERSASTIQQPSLHG
jgi:hypothetical protein